MTKPTIAVLGGCHVMGYALTDGEDFPILAARLLNGILVEQVANVQFIHLPKQLAHLDGLRPTHVVLQLGNYEFSASFRLLIRQFKRAFNLIKSTKLKQSASQPVGSSSAFSNVASHEVPKRGWLAERVRVTGLGLFTGALWLTSAKHQRAFRALNERVQRCPDTAFILLSPFPCLEPAANTMRQFGGWLMRRRLQKRPNLFWIDSHRLLRADRELFVDQLHLNGEAHRLVAHGVAAFSLQPTHCLA